MRADAAQRAGKGPSFFLPEKRQKRLDKQLAKTYNISYHSGGTGNACVYPPF